MTTSVLTSLERRRAKFLAQANAAETTVSRLRADIEHIDGVIRGYRTRTPHIPRAKRVEMSRIAFSVLREASAPMSLRALALAVMERAGHDTQDRKKVLARMDRLRTLLNRQAKVGVMRRAEGPGQSVLWEVVK